MMMIHPLGYPYPAPTTTATEREREELTEEQVAQDNHRNLIWNYEGITLEGSDISHT